MSDVHTLGPAHLHALTATLARLIIAHHHELAKALDIWRGRRPIPEFSTGDPGVWTCVRALREADRTNDQALTLPWTRALLVNLSAEAVRDARRYATTEVLAWLGGLPLHTRIATRTCANDCTFELRKQGWVLLGHPTRRPHDILDAVLAHVLEALGTRPITITLEVN